MRRKHNSYMKRMNYKLIYDILLTQGKQLRSQIFEITLGTVNQIFASMYINKNYILINFIGNEVLNKWVNMIQFRNTYQK